MSKGIALDDLLTFRTEPGFDDISTADIEDNIDALRQSFASTNPTPDQQEGYDNTLRAFMFNQAERRGDKAWSPERLRLDNTNATTQDELEVYEQEQIDARTAGPLGWLYKDQIANDVRRHTTQLINQSNVDMSKNADLLDTLGNIIPAFGAGAAGTIEMAREGLLGGLGLVEQDGSGLAAVERFMGTDPRLADTGLAKVMQGAGSTVGSIGSAVAGGLAGTAVGAVAGANPATAVGTGAFAGGLAFNAAVRYGEGYKFTLLNTGDKDKAVAGGWANTPGAIIESLADKLIATRALTASAKTLKKTLATATTTAGKRQALAAYATSAGKSTAVGFAAEGTAETLGDLVSGASLAGYTGLRDPLTLAEERWLETFIIGGIVGGAMGGGAALFSDTTTLRKARQAGLKVEDLIDENGVMKDNSEVSALIKTRIN